MPDSDWLSQVVAVTEVVDVRSSEASRYLLFSAQAVAGLEYLSEVDGRYFQGGWTSFPQEPDVVDVNHARWALSSAMTATDLVAASIGALHLSPKRNGQAHDMGDLTKFDSDGTGRAARCAPCERLIGHLLVDPDWLLLKARRDLLIHRAMPRTLHGYTHDPDDLTPHRIMFHFGEDEPVSTTSLLIASTELARRHVIAFSALARFHSE